MKFAEFFLSIFKRRLLFILILTVLCFATVFVILKFYSNRKVLVGKKAEENAIPISITIPDGAYSVKKSFLVRRISRDNLPASITSMFVGDLFEVSPSDGIDEFSMKSITITYRLTRDLYLGDDYANVRIAYIPDITQPLYRIFGGATMGLDQKGPYVEVQAFHTSVIGLIADVPEKQKLGLQLLVERTKSIEPVLLLIPDVDKGFLGFVNSTRQGPNFWMELFPNRTIMYYEYPVSGTRSKSYMDSFRSFSQKNMSSFILFEAEKLALELMRLKNFEFDIVAHGIGAIIARLAVELHSEIKNVRSLVLVSPPNRGTNVVNPLYYGALLYRKDSQMVASNFGLDRFVVDAMKSHLLYYLEALGPIYKEILVGSDLLKKLDGTVRKDVRYLIAVGSSPPASIDVGRTQLELFYPELVAGKGDGVVSQDSAFLEGTQKVVLKGSFFDCYLDPNFHGILKKFLAQALVEIPKYKEETYPERSYQAQQTEKIVKPQMETRQPTQTQTQQNERVVTQRRVIIPSRFERSQLLVKLETLSLGNVIGVYPVGRKLYYVLNDGLYTDNKRIHAGNLQYVHAIKSGMSFVIDDKVYFFNGIKVTNLGRISLMNVEDVIATDNAIFALLRGKESLIFARWENNWKEILNLSGVYGKFIDGSNPLLITNREIYEISEGGLKKILDASQLKIDGRSVDFKSCLLVSDLLFIGLRSYSLVVYDLKSGAYAWGAEGWIEPERFILLNDMVLIQGTSTLFVFDLSKMSLRTVYHSFPTKVDRLIAIDEKIYVLSESRVEVYKFR